MSIYDFQVTKADGSAYSMKEYQDKVIIIVNTASKCGFAPQFEGLEALYQKYQAQGLVVLGFPSNQFKQELDDAKQAEEFCKLDYGVTFPMHSITTVNGENADPLFRYLEEEMPGALGKNIKWNFTKFLVDRNGKVVSRYAPKTAPEKMVADIEKLL